MNIEYRQAFRLECRWTCVLWLCCVVLLCTGLLSCQKRRNEQQARQQRYELHGKVVSVDKAQRQITVAHDEVKGYMPAMTMPFPLKDEWAFDVLSPGDDISAALIVDGSSPWLEEIVISKRDVDQPSGASQPPATGEPQPGDEVPDFSFVNQDGKRINLKQYRGKALLLTFIYTRCPVPDFCTLMSDNFAQVDQELRKTPSLYAQTHLLSVSIDPKYDTPKVLRSYGAAHTGNYSEEKFTHWEFATGEALDVQSAAKYFGLTYYQETDQIVHALRTAIITPDGKIFTIYRGNEWKPTDALRDLTSALGKSS
jgi:protein SCO1/2